MKAQNQNAGSPGKAIQKLHPPGLSEAFSSQSSCLQAGLLLRFLFCLLRIVRTEAYLGEPAIPETYEWTHFIDEKTEAEKFTILGLGPTWANTKASASSSTWHMETVTWRVTGAWRLSLRGTWASWMLTGSSNTDEEIPKWAETQDDGAKLPWTFLLTFSQAHPC